MREERLFKYKTMRTEEPMIDGGAELPLHREWMFQIARARLGNLHICDDFVQNVILRAVR